MSRKNCYKIEAESLNLKEKQQNKQSLKFFIFSPLFSNVKRGKWKLSPAHYLQVTHQRLTLHNPHGALCCHWTWCSLPLGYTLRLKRRGNFHSFTSHIRNTSSLDTKHAHTLEQPDVSAKCLRFGWPRVCKKAQRGLGRNIFRFSSVTLWFLWDWGSDPKTVELQSGHNTCILSSPDHLLMDDITVIILVCFQPCAQCQVPIQYCPLRIIFAQTKKLKSMAYTLLLSRKNRGCK